MTPKAAMAATKYVDCFSCTPPMGTFPDPSSDVKITRNINGNANVKNADAGFRQNALLVKRTCRRASAAPLIGVSRGAGLAAGELEVDVLEARPRDLER